jgi:two-component system sensor histidine kinase KdpD
VRRRASPSGTPRGWLFALLWWTVLAAATVAMVSLRGRLDKAHIALLLLLIVLGGSATGGRFLGLLLAGASFLVFNWFFLPPYDTFVVGDPLDWLALLVFLGTSVVAAHLLSRARAQAAAAEARAAEVDRLAALGAETLSAGRAEDALTAVAVMIRATLGVAVCEIFMRRDDDTLGLSARSAGDDWTDGGEITRRAGSLPEWVAESGSAAVERGDGTMRLAAARPRLEDIALQDAGEPTALLLPLQVRERTVGVLRLANPAGVQLDPERWRFLQAISYYAALGVERVRLVGEADHAEALREGDRLKDALLATVSHDLRTPLTTIKALAHDLSSLGDERAEIIEREADRLNRFVTDLLDLSRLNAGAVVLRLELNAVDELLGAVVQRMEPTIGEGRLTVRLPPDDPLLFGRFDFAQSLRVLSNLVENAAKYAPGTIELNARRDGPELLVSVGDRGTGIPPADLGKIFEPFYRGDAAARDVTGAGLGLSIARRLAELQGGRLTYEKRSGGGSVFTLHLPAVDIANFMTQTEGAESL